MLNADLLCFQARVETAGASSPTYVYLGNDALSPNVMVARAHDNHALPAPGDIGEFRMPRKRNHEDTPDGGISGGRQDDPQVPRMNLPDAATSQQEALQYDKGDAKSCAARAQRRLAMAVDYSDIRDDDGIQVYTIENVVESFYHVNTNLLHHVVLWSVPDPHGGEDILDTTVEPCLQAGFEHDVMDAGGQGASSYSLQLKHITDALMESAEFIRFPPPRSGATGPSAKCWIKDTTRLPKGMRLSVLGGGREWMKEAHACVNPNPQQHHNPLSENKVWLCKGSHDNAEHSLIVSVMEKPQHTLTVSDPIWHRVEFTVKSYKAGTSNASFGSYRLEAELPFSSQPEQTPDIMHMDIDTLEADRMIWLQRVHYARNDTGLLDGLLPQMMPMRGDGSLTTAGATGRGTQGKETAVISSKQKQNKGGPGAPGRAAGGSGATMEQAPDFQDVHEIFNQMKDPNGQATPQRRALATKLVMLGHTAFKAVSKTFNCTLDGVLKKNELVQAIREKKGLEEWTEQSASLPRICYQCLHWIMQ